MFERGKKDDGQGDGSRAAEPALGFGSGMSRTPARSGEVAVIGRSIQINGDLRGDEDLRIEGDVSGTVELRNSNLTIGKEGRVRADVYAKSIAVDGTTEGDLYATERVVIHVNARVNGNIVAPRVAIEEGARFKGAIEMDQAAVEKALGKPKVQPIDGPKSGRSDSRAASGKDTKDGGSGLNTPAGAA